MFHALFKGELKCHIPILGCLKNTVVKKSKIRASKNFLKCLTINSVSLPIDLIDLDCLYLSKTVTALGFYSKVLQKLSQGFTFVFDHASLAFILTRQDTSNEIENPLRWVFSKPQNYKYIA